MAAKQSIPIIVDIGEMRTFNEELRHRGNDIVLVPTMGALHQGHLALVRQAAATDKKVIVSIFINPIQFGPQEDYGEYPRDLVKDVQLLAQESVSAIFTPNVNQIYPQGFNTYIVNNALGNILEGGAREGHFKGVLTIVAKLFNITGCSAAVFGEKDYQQLILIKQMVADLNLPVEIISVPIVRDADGLALSSRNQYLTTAQRKLAAALPAALQAVSDLVVPTKTNIEKFMQEKLITAGLQIDYVKVMAENLQHENPIGLARLLVAVRVGRVRLLDNTKIKVVEK